MKKQLSIILCTIFATIGIEVVCFLISLPSIISKFPINIDVYHDVDIYKEESYLTTNYIAIKSSDYYYNKATKEASEFIPKYKDIDYKYSSLDFYIYDSSFKDNEQSVTYTLDIYFDDINIYNEEKEEIYINHHIGEYKTTKGDFECISVDDKKVNEPFSCKIICLSEKMMCIRYIFY